MSLIPTHQHGGHTLTLGHPQYLGYAVTATNARFHQVTCGTTFFLQRHHVVDGLAQRQREVFCWWKMLRVTFLICVSYQPLMTLVCKKRELAFNCFLNNQQRGKWKQVKKNKKIKKSKIMTVAFTCSIKRRNEGWRYQKQAHHSGHLHSWHPTIKINQVTQLQQNSFLFIFIVVVFSSATG